MVDGEKHSQAGHGCWITRTRRRTLHRGAGSPDALSDKESPAVPHPTH
ncbi:hypothetical protein DB31_3642 [Hyalangium minutum]|uniref:Uncharacterized protein n=1 Tax=Hyalangium minutum TaxID=394096 RepID=A0A085WUZ9_9BACT|nr:hypothetical protein DB31_3642 [Hyalangium minutum]